MNRKLLLLFLAVLNASLITPKALAVFVLNTNIKGLIAEYNLPENSNDLQNTSARLSSGFRINQAVDDPTGLIINARLRTEFDNLRRQQATEVAIAGMAVQGARQEIFEQLSNIRILASKAASANSADKGVYYSEIQQILNRIDSLNQSIDSRSLLDGGNSSLLINY